MLCDVEFMFLFIFVCYRVKWLRSMINFFLGYCVINFN